MFGLLSAGRLAEYLARPLPPEALLVFLHIPKTAGSSITTDLARLFAPYRNIAPDYTDASRPFEQREAEALARFAAEAPTRRPRSASGHYHLRRLRPLLRGLEPLAFASMVRDPVARVVSDYRYMTSERHPDWRQARARFPTLDDYLAHPVSAEKMARYLLADPRMPPDEIPGFLDETYHALGAVEEYELSSYLLFALGGHRTVSTARERVAADGPTRREALPPSLIERIAAANPRDAAIHAHVSAALARCKPAWLALREEAPPTAAPGPA
ncbi:MAG: sulfotransferase family protein [Acetobacteraceae bacterium]|nr:sulfotransferase family protein [Acetobacteraceae bacterium]